MRRVRRGRAFDATGHRLDESQLPQGIDERRDIDVLARELPGQPGDHVDPVPGAQPPDHLDADRGEQHEHVGRDVADQETVALGDDAQRPDPPAAGRRGRAGRGGAGPGRGRNADHAGSRSPGRRRRADRARRIGRPGIAVGLCGAAEVDQLVRARGNRCRDVGEIPDRLQRRQSTEDLGDRPDAAVDPLRRMACSPAATAASTPAARPSRYRSRQKRQALTPGSTDQYTPWMYASPDRMNGTPAATHAWFTQRSISSGCVDRAHHQIHAGQQLRHVRRAGDPAPEGTTCTVGSNARSHSATRSALDSPTWSGNR